MRNIVVYLIRGNDASISALEKSLSLLKENFLPWSPADILVFHEDNMKPSQLEGRTAGLPVKTALVDFSSVPPEMADVPPEKRGYRHMCHFFANDIFFRGELDGYDKYFDATMTQGKTPEEVMAEERMRESHLTAVVDRVMRFRFADALNPVELAKLCGVFGVPMGYEPPLVLKHPSLRDGISSRRRS